jgi:hypothetical protein
MGSGIQFVDGTADFFAFAAAHRAINRCPCAVPPVGLSSREQRFLLVWHCG